jgi:hypothetical protein
LQPKQRVIISSAGADRLKLFRLYEHQGLTIFLLVLVILIGGAGVLILCGSVPSINPCLPAAQQEAGNALAMPLTVAEVTGSAVAVLLFWLLIQRQTFLGKNWLRWTVSVFCGGALGILGIWVVSYLAPDCAKQAIGNSGDFGVGPIFAFGNSVTEQFWNARVIEVAFWVTFCTLVLGGGRRLWLNAQR